MKDITCLVCKKEFYGRDNQVFCSSECKNKHYNAQTRLIYRIGKEEKGEIANIQSQMYEYNDRIIKANDIFDEETANYKSEIAILRSDYTDLLEKYEKLKADLQKIRSQYFDARQSMQKMDDQLKLLGLAAEMLRPAIEKITENLGKTKKDNS
jgi:hypothetical protein